MNKPTSQGFKSFPLLVAGALFVVCFAGISNAQSPSAPVPGQGTSASGPSASPAPAVPVQAAKATLPPARQLGRLKLGKPVERELKGGESDVYVIKVKKGRFLHVVAKQKGIDVVVSIISPDGKTLVTADSPNGAWGPEPASLITGKSGTYQVIVKSLDGHAMPGQYEVKLGDLRKPLPEDEIRIAAEKDLFEGSALGSQPGEEAHRKAIEAYEHSLPLWKKLGDEYEQGLALQSIGENQGSLGNLKAKLASFLEALPFMQASGQKVGEADLLTKLGDFYHDREERRKALEYYERALEIYRNTGMQGAEAGVLTQIGVQYRHLGEAQRALDIYTQALALHRQVKNDKGEAITLSSMGLAYESLGQPKDALNCYTQALQIQKAIGGRGEEANTLNNLGVLYESLSEYDEALESFNQALPFGSRAERARTQGNIGQVHYARGEYRQALDDFTETLKIIGNEPAVGARAIALEGMGLVYLRLGEKEKALSYLSQAVELERAAEERALEAGTLANIASVHLSSGEIKQALDLLEESLKVARTARYKPGEAVASGDIGVMYLELGQPEKALPYLQESVRLLGEIGERANQAVGLQNIAGAYSSLNQPQKALEYYEQALPLVRESGYRAGEAGILSNIGNQLEVMGKSKEALNYLNQALSLFRSIGDREAEPNTLERIGTSLDQLGKKAQALESYTAALAMTREVKEPIEEASILAYLMGHWRNESASTAIFFGKQAINTYQNVRANLKGLTQESQKSFIESHSWAYRMLAEILIAQGRLSEAEQVLDLLKNEEYFEFVRRSGTDAASLTGAVSLTTPEKKEEARYRELGEEIAALGRERGELEAKKTRTPEEEARLSELNKAVEDANHNFDGFLKDLYKELGSSEQASGRTIKVQEDVGALQNALRALPAGTVGLYTFLADEQYHAIVVTREVSVERHYDIKREELRDKVEQFRDALRSPRTNPVPLAQELYKILLAPVERDLTKAGAKMVMLSLDDVLRYVPFAALHDGRQYVVETYRTEVFTTASLLNLKEKPSIASWSGLGMGVSKPLGGMPALPTVPEELHQVIRDSQDSSSNGVVPGRVMLDEAFTEDGMKNELKKNYPLVHIASHFVSAPGNYGDSYLLLGEGDGKHLTLAEIHDSPEIRFNDTELLTLSACNTAMGGKSDGREINGLGMMAQLKGAKAVVASLWDVYDNSTGLLMADFYDRWIHTPGMTKGDALRAAQLDLLHSGGGATGNPSRESVKPGSGIPALSSQISKAESKSASRPVYSHPFYWAPFILIGNWQ